ncbi:aldehyde dehydrogenase family protein [Streptomyces hirsutus]|uniref:aldehyde dehydrogenase family protein n=1 Tax=Streptomyces hirsutus TaxID=35620 RepID=UPI00099E6290|nr:aldehyde dehydrogenase family protein [Streptomyces hirsutus]
MIHTQERASVGELTHFSGGRPTPGTSGAFGEVHDPDTGEVQTRVPLASRAETEEAINDAERAQHEWGQWNLQRRARVLLRFLQLAQQEKDSLARLLSAEHSKTVADAHGDLQPGLEAVECEAGIPHLLKGEFTDNAGTGIDFCMRTKTVTSRRPAGLREGAKFTIPTTG